MVRSGIFFQPYNGNAGLMLKRATYLIPLFLGLAFAAVITAGYYAEKERYAQKSRLQVFNKLSTVQSGFENALNAKLNVAKGLKSYVALNPDIDQQTFAALAKGLVSDIGGIRFLELARNNVVTHIYPLPETSPVLNRSLLKDFPDDIRDMVIRAMSTRQEQILAPRSLFEGGEAIVAATPVYVGQGGNLHYWGLISVLIDANALYREAGLVGTLPGLDIALRKPGLSHGESLFMAGKKSVFGQNPVTMNIPTPDGYWQVAAVPVGGWGSSPSKRYIIIGGVIATLITMGLLWAGLLLLQGRLDDREKYRYLVQNAKSIILRINMAGDIVYCNEHAEEFYGYEQGELIGKPLIGTLIPEKNLEGESMKRYLNRLLRNPAAHPFNETMNVRKNGEIVWVAWANKSVLNREGLMVELLSVGTDITDRKLMEESLRQREKQYRLLAENVTDIIWGLDADTRYTFVSPSDETLRGFKRYDVLSRPVGDFLTPASIRLLADVLTILDGGAGDAEHPPYETVDLEFICADGSTVWLENRVGVLYNEEGEKIGIQGVGRDITDRKLAEALRDDVERMARHDLKTPLGAVIGLPDEIRSLGRLNASQTAMLDTIEEAGNAMLQLINRSLDLYKMERGTYSLRKTSVDVANVLDRIRTECRPVIREKGISLGIEARDMEEGQAFIALVEEDLFKSMLSNLVLNALQASPEGGMVSIVLEKTDNVVITIHNQGAVPPALYETFFDKYSSSDTSSGTGLGTYSARLIARTHGGDIAVDTSTPGETKITVTLPV